MPIFGQKNVNSVKTTLYYKPKNSIRPPFVRIYLKNTVLMPIFYQKTSILKKHIVLTPIFCKKCPFAQKHGVLASFFKILMKYPCCNVHIWSTNVNAVQITLLFGWKKSIGCPFFHLSLKNDCSYAHIMSKKLQFSNIALMPIFCQKTSILSKTRRSHVIFFYKIDVTPIFCQKNVYSLKNTAITCLFFSNFS